MQREFQHRVYLRIMKEKGKEERREVERRERGRKRKRRRKRGGEERYEREAAVQPPL